MQTLPSSSCSSSFPWAVLLIDMNLKNFPKSLDSKTSCLRITIPENLDLALEGLIRKVLKEQPKIDEIYAFAADYFDMLLKIRDKVGTKFTGDMHCPFHNDEDAHEMIKLASVFAKPGIIKTKMPEAEKIKNSDNKARKKEPAKSKRESEKTVRNIKQPVEIQRKPELLAKEKKDRNIPKMKPEEQKQLKIEPKTEDVGDDEEFLKSDSIKLLVEKELMDAAKPRPEDKEKETEHDTNASQIGKLEEFTEKEELCSVKDKESKKTEIINNDEIVSKEKENKMEAAAEGKKEDVKKEEEKNAMEKAEIKIHNTKKGEAQEEIMKVLNSASSAAGKEIKKELKNDAKTNIQDDITEIKNENKYVKSIESLTAEEKIQKPATNETEAEAKIKDITQAEINPGTPKEAPEVQNVPKGKSSEGIMELAPEKDERAMQEETQDAAKNKITKEQLSAKEVNISPDEMCTVVDVLSITTREKDESNAEQVKKRAVEPEFKKEEGVNESKINTDEVLTDKDKEGAQTQKLMEAFEKTIESTFPKKAEEANIAISPNGNELQEECEKFIPEKVKIIEEPSDTANSVEKLKVQINVEDAKSDPKATMQEREVENIDSKETEFAPLKDQKSTEDDLQGMQDNEATQISKITEDDLVLEEKTVKDIPKTTIEKEKDSGLEDESRFKKNPIKPSENEDHLIIPENAETAKPNKNQPENKGMELEENSEVTEEELQQVKTEIKAENLILNHEMTKNNKLEEVNSVKNDQKPSEDSSITKEQTDVTEFRSQPEVQDEWQEDELKPKEGMKSLKEVEVTEEKNINEKSKEKNDVTEFSEKADIVENPEQAVETFPKDSEKEKLLIMQEAIKTLDESEKTETLKIDSESTSLLGNKSAKELSTEPNTSMPRGELNTVTESQHVIKIEEAEKLPEESPCAEGVQIKTIQTHYYDTLQVPIKSTKEYRVHPVKNGSAVGNLLNIANVVLSSDKRELTETSVPPLDLPQQDDDDELFKKELEDSLMTPSSSSSLNVSELSIQTISEMFLNSEKQYSAREAERIKFLKETGDNCGNENHTEKREVEDIFYKTIVPPPIKATPVAPRDDSEIKEETNVEASLKDEKKQDSSVDSEERVDSSNEKSVDSDTPHISVEVKTVIETQNLEDKEQEKDGGGPEAEGGSDVQIRIEATIDVPEGVEVNVREEKEYKDEVRQHASNEPPTLETIPKDSQTSSGESESTTSSTATEIKRNDSTERLFSCARTLINTQSLDLDKRNPLLKTRSLSSFRQGVIDFEVWNAIEKELEEAATKIQSNFRGYKTRKKLQRENAVNITTEESSCSTTPVEPESKEDRQQSTGEFHDTIVLSEHPR